MSGLTFKLPDGFVHQYSERPVDWGFPMGGGNFFGELQFLTKYSRIKPEGGKERWHETCRRVIEGMYSLLKDHCSQNLSPWSEDKAYRSAAEAYERLFIGKWTPPGRGLWMMGTDFVNGKRDSSALQNCGMISTQTLDANPAMPFIRLMEMQMLGIGVGFDTRGAGKVRVYRPRAEVGFIEVIADSREGWFSSVELLLMSYFQPGWRRVEFDYTKIRPAGEPIRGFGGKAAGPEPLRQLHERLRRLLDGRAGELLRSVDIVDIMNMVGKCVVAANVRSSAEIALGYADDVDFINIKNYELHPERMGPDGWGYTSNNSILAEVGGHYDHLIPRIVENGEPGLIYLDNCRKYGRLIDPRNDKDARVVGINPCGEQPLEDGELCTLVETYPTRHADLDDYIRTLKFAFMYAKAVTLLPTHWPETNAVMQRNRRIGTSMSGVAQFIEKHGWATLRKWDDAAYHAVVARDVQYSEWLGVRESIKRTTIKPAGTTSLLVGVTPGVHWPKERGHYLRTSRFNANEVVVDALDAARYQVEPNVMNPTTGRVATFPIEGPNMRSETEVSIWEKVALAATQQEWWSDNSVSCTASFQPHEGDQIGPVLRAFDGRLKAISFLPLLDGGAYPQMPYQKVEQAEWRGVWEKARPLDWDGMYAEGAEAVGEAYCTTDVCELDAARTGV